MTFIHNYLTVIDQFAMFVWLAVGVFMLAVGVYLLAVFFYWIIKGNKEE